MKLIFNNATATDSTYTNVDNGFAQISKQGLIEYSFPTDPHELKYIFISGIYETAN